MADLTKSSHTLALSVFHNLRYIPKVTGGDGCRNKLWGRKAKTELYQILLIVCLTPLSGTACTLNLPYVSNNNQSYCGNYTITWYRNCVLAMSGMWIIMAIHYNTTPLSSSRELRTGFTVLYLEKTLTPATTVRICTPLNHGTESFVSLGYVSAHLLLGPPVRAEASHGLQQT